jgi:hypothetical protein
MGRESIALWILAFIFSVLAAALIMIAILKLRGAF